MNVQNSESLLQAYGLISPTAHHTLIRPENTTGITCKQTSPVTQASAIVNTEQLTSNLLKACYLGERDI